MTEEERKLWEQNKRNQISKLVYSVRKRAKERGIEFNLDHKYLCAIAPNLCPVFKIPLRWGHGQTEIKGVVSEHSPSLDRIIPEKGYTRGNVAFISHRANTIKSSATERELYAVADWVHQKRKEVLNGGARPPAYDDPANTYLVRPAYTDIATGRGPAQAGGD